MSRAVIFGAMGHKQTMVAPSGIEAPDRSAGRESLDALGWLVMVLAALAAGVAGYLTYESLVRGVLPAGCGSGSGCSEVLSSKYARLFTIPVSLLALLSYLGLLLLFPRARRRPGSWTVAGVAALAVAILASAGWFVYLQLVELRAICPWCMTDHALGVLAALGALVSLRHVPRPRLLVGGSLGIMAAALVVILQINSSAAVQTLDGVQVSLLDGRFALQVESEPHFGPADAPARLFVLFDYACPHCRFAHDQLKQMQSGRDDLLLVLLPATIETRCNPAFTSVPERFDGSCELAELALAVHLAAPEAFAAYDQWLYDWEGHLPRPVEAARAEAERLVGPAALEAILAGGKPGELLQRNVELLTATTADHVPVILAPGHPPVVGRIESEDSIRHLLAPPPAAP